MHFRELLELLRKADVDPEQMKRILDISDLLVQDMNLGIYAHKTYLPAARDYLRGKHSGDHRTKRARIRRARLGGASRWLYQHQKQTFVKLVNILCPSVVPITDDMINVAWSFVKKAEQKALRHGRKYA